MSLAEFELGIFAVRVPPAGSRRACFISRITKSPFHTIFNNFTERVQSLIHPALPRRKGTNAVSEVTIDSNVSDLSMESIRLLLYLPQSSSITRVMATGSSGGRNNNIISQPT